MYIYRGDNDNKRVFVKGAREKKWQIRDTNLLVVQGWKVCLVIIVSQYCKWLEVADEG